MPYTCTKSDPRWKVQGPSVQFKKQTTPKGFEPLRAEPTHLAGERLNRSAKASLDTFTQTRAILPHSKEKYSVKNIAEGGFDPPTFGL